MTRLKVINASPAPPPSRVARIHLMTFCNAACPCYLDPNDGGSHRTSGL